MNWDEGVSLELLNKLMLMAGLGGVLERRGSTT